MNQDTDTPRSRLSPALEPTIDLEMNDTAVDYNDTNDGGGGGGGFGGDDTSITIKLGVFYTTKWRYRFLVLLNFILSNVVVFTSPIMTSDDTNVFAKYILVNLLLLYPVMCVIIYDFHTNGFRVDNAYYGITNPRM